MSQTADRNLLLGILALQTDFITRDELIAAMLAWSVAKHRPLEDILVDQGALDPAYRDLLRPMVDLHIARHGGAEQSLAAISRASDVAADLKRAIADSEVQASIGHVGASHGGPTIQTQQPGPDDSTVTLPRFRRVRNHAHGGLGVVYVAHDRELNREVALKEIQESRADDPVSRGRFLLEAEITGGLEHPGIVPVYGLGHYFDGRPFYAMRFIRGDSLKDAIARFHQAEKPGRDPGERTLTLQKLLRRFLDVCNAIAYAHSRGVLHRDLKPNNIMVGKYGETLVVDWGLAKATGHSVADDAASLPESTLRPSSSGVGETMPGSAIGTPAYMPPEQAAGRLDLLGPASDVYSLGATLYTLLTDKAPITGVDVSEILCKVERGEFPRPREASPWLAPALEAVCLKAMALRPDDRYPSPGALADDVEHWLADEPVSALPERLPAKIQRWMRRHKSATLSAAAALLAISVAATSAFLVVRSALASERKALAASTKALAAEQTALTAERTALAAQKMATEAAERDRKRAEQRESMAVDAIKKFEKAVVDNPLLKNDPRLKPLRDALLKEPLQFSRALRELLQADGDTRPESLARLADACYNLGHTTAEIGDQEDALKAYGESLEIRERLARDNPTVAAYQNRLASSHNNLGVLQAHTGRADLAAVSYARALEIRERLARDNPTVAEFQAGLAASHNNLGNLHSAAGRADLALESHARALEIGERLARDNPTVAEFQADLAASHNNLGNLHSAAGRADLALESHARALEIRERLARDDPTVAAYQSDLALSHYNLGNLQRDTGRADLAAASYARAIEIHERLARDNPTVTAYQYVLAASHNNLGDLQSATGRGDLAAVSYARALEIFERLARGNPTVAAYQNDLAGSHNNLGGLQADTGRADLAAASFARAIEIGERLARGNPTVAAYQNDVAASHDNLGILQAAAGRADLALESHARALEIGERLARDNPTVAEFQAGLAASHNNLGNLHSAAGRADLALESHARALEIYERLARDNPTIAAYQTNVAKSHYLIARALALKSAATSDSKMAKTLADQAMESLRRADAAGWSNWKHAAEDDDLKSLRDRPDFQALLRERMKPKDAAKP
jgi:serine/threonine protein kinase/Flp pilus assembly protein TadD